MNMANREAIVAWGFLVAATLVISWVSESSALGATAAVVVTMVVAALKARIIVLHYMELKHAPIAWRVAFEAWVLIASAVIVLGYLLTGTQ